MIIDNIPNSPQRGHNDELSKYEFFECDFCSAICEMPIEEYRKYDEDVIAQATFKCARCTTGVEVVKRENKRPGVGGRPKSEAMKNFTIEQYERLRSEGYSNIQIAKDVLKCTHQTLYKVLKSLGYTKPRKEKQTVKQEKKKESNQPKPLTNMVEHPPHYTAGKVECIDAIESAVIGLDGQEAYIVGNIIKYLWRFKRKNGLEDLKKAEWYLKRLMDKQS